MALQVVVGAGPVGWATAMRLVEGGHDVRMLSRSLPRIALDGVAHAAVDATNLEELVAKTARADALYNCASPAYHRWATDWPPLAAAMLGAAEQTGAVLVTMSNLYGYGPVDHPMTEADPLRATGPKGRVRAEMWAQALAAHHAGRVRVTEARASDYFGPGVGPQSPVGERSIPRLLTGQTIRVFGAPDVAHSWTYVLDVAATLVTLGTDARAWGRAWHVPTGPPMTQREMFTALARVAGAADPRLRAVPGWALLAAGAVNPAARAMREVRYQFDRPFVIDSSAFETTFAAQPTPIDHALTATMSRWLTEPRAAA